MRKYSIFSITVFITFFFSISFAQVHAQPKNILYSNQQWFQYYNKCKINSKYTFLSDASFRWKNEFNDYSLALVRFGLAYNFYKTNSVAAGIAFTTAFNYNNPERGELRIWQELNIPSQKNRIFFNNRLRMEERFFKRITDNDLALKTNFNYRLRYRLSFSIPLNHSTFLPGTISINLGDEVFINFGDEIIYNTLDANRLLAGLNYQITKNFFVTLNYMNQFGQKNTKNTYEQNDVVWLSFTHTIENSQSKNKTN